ncbi:hypothetical protein TNCV_3001811 [Trichonephila clavipes]|nr:hypothetical protein TNCV_3001811 [Trichonephila clavipes]
MESLSCHAPPKGAPHSLRNAGLDESLVAIETIFEFCIHSSVSEDKGNDEASVSIDCDKELPYSLKSEWTELCSEVPELKSVSLPRYHLWNMKDDVESLAVHNSSDSSKREYSCVICLRAVCKNGNIGTSFIASKSRVTPIKLSLPRLELLGALYIIGY